MVLKPAASQLLWSVVLTHVEASCRFSGVKTLLVCFIEMVVAPALFVAVFEEGSSLSEAAPSRFVEIVFCISLVLFAETRGGVLIAHHKHNGPTIDLLTD